MKRLLLGLAALAVVITLPLDAFTNSFGAPAGRTGSPADGGATCNASGCHSGSAVNSGSGSISVSAPSTYAAGQTVSLSVTVDHDNSGRIGFQVSVLDPADAHTGALVITDTQNTQFTATSTNFVTHRAAPGGQASRTFNFDWTAPDPAPESVTFYIAGNAANGNFNNAGDQIYTTQFIMNRESGVAVEPEVIPAHFALESAYPNPVRDRATVDVNLPRSTTLSLRVIDLLGRERLRRKLVSMEAGRHSVPVSVAGLGSGTYLLVVETAAGQSATRHLTVAR